MEQRDFKLHAPYQPAGDQPEAIRELVEGFESSSAALNNMSVKFRCPAVSMLASIPKDLFGFGLVNYPTAVFVDRGVFTGAYSNIESKEKFAEACELFISDGSIAYKRNNQIAKG